MAGVNAYQFKNASMDALFPGARPADQPSSGPAPPPRVQAPMYNDAPSPAPTPAPPPMAAPAPAPMPAPPPTPGPAAQPPIMAAPNGPSGPLADQAPSQQPLQAMIMPRTVTHVGMEQERDPEIERALTDRLLPASSRALQQIAAQRGRIY